MTNTNTFSYAAPTIASLTPGLLPTSGGQNCPFTAIGHGQITCTVPAGSGTNLAVFATVDGKTSGALTFSYNAPTAITGLRGAAGAAGGVVGAVGFGLLLLLTVGWVFRRRRGPVG